MSTPDNQPSKKQPKLESTQPQLAKDYKVPDNQTDWLSEIFVRVDKRIINGIAIAIARDEPFDTDPILDEAKAAIKTKLTEAKIEVLRNYLEALKDDLPVVAYTSLEAMIIELEGSRG